MDVPGTIYLIDTSALARLATPDVSTVIESVIDDGAAATCLTIDLEVGFSARNSTALNLNSLTRAQLFSNLAITEEIAERARRVQALMASRGLHRAAGPMDLITAAIAEHYRAVVLHYDADFEHIASVTGQQHAWVVPRGSID